MEKRSGETSRNEIRIAADELCGAKPQVKKSPFVFFFGTVRTGSVI